MPDNGAEQTGVADPGCNFRLPDLDGVLVDFAEIALALFGGRDIERDMADSVSCFPPLAAASVGGYRPVWLPNESKRCPASGMTGS
ncbi:MAG: hypothetical protein GX803_00130 [Lentisphaerae bacterium]|jgi:hypothetical protein|nr:hypothetical protein [Lentisphaerota bacterium]